MAVCAGVGGNSQKIVSSLCIIIKKIGLRLLPPLFVKFC